MGVRAANTGARAWERRIHSACAHSNGCGVGSCAGACCSGRGSADRPQRVVELASAGTRRRVRLLRSASLSLPFRALWHDNCLRTLSWPPSHSLIVMLLCLNCSQSLSGGCGKRSVLLNVHVYRSLRRTSTCCMQAREWRSRDCGCRFACAARAWLCWCTCSSCPGGRPSRRQCAVVMAAPCARAQPKGQVQFSPGTCHVIDTVAVCTSPCKLCQLDAPQPVSKALVTVSCG